MRSGRVRLGGAGSGLVRQIRVWQGKGVGYPTPFFTQKLQK